MQVTYRKPDHILYYVAIATILQFSPKFKKFCLIYRIWNLIALSVCTKVHNFCLPVQGFAPAIVKWQEHKVLPEFWGTWYKSITSNQLQSANISFRLFCENLKSHHCGYYNFQHSPNTLMWWIAGWKMFNARFPYKRNESDNTDAQPFLWKVIAILNIIP